MVEARNLGSKLIVQAFIRLESSVKEAEFHLMLLILFVFEKWVNFEIIVGIPL